MKNTVFNTFGFSLHTVRFIYLGPGEAGPSTAAEAAAAEAAKETPKAEQTKSAEYESYAKEIAELGVSIAPERYEEIRARLDSVDARIGKDAKLSQAEKNELQNSALRARNKFTETINSTFQAWKNETEASIAQTWHSLIGTTGDALKIAGRSIASVATFGATEWGPGLVEKHDQGVATAAQRETLQALAATSPDAKVALAKLDEAETLTKKVSEATAMAEKYAQSGWRGQEVNGKKIDTYTGADVKIQGETKNYTMLDSENVTQGMLIAAYMLGGEAEVQKVVEMLATGQKGHGVNAKVDIATMNDYENSGVGGATFGKFEKDHDEVGSPLNAFATMYLSKAKKTLSPEQYNEYAAVVDTKLAALNLAIKNGGNADILRSKFMAEVPTPDKFLEDKAPKASPTPEPAAPVQAPSAQPQSEPAVAAGSRESTPVAQNTSKPSPDQPPVTLKKPPVAPKLKNADSRTPEDGDADKSKEKIVAALTTPDTDGGNRYKEALATGDPRKIAAAYAEVLNADINPNKMPKKVLSVTTPDGVKLAVGNNGSKFSVLVVGVTPEAVKTNSALAALPKVSRRDDDAVA